MERLPSLSLSLIKIALLESNRKEEEKRCKVEEELRGNQYRIHLHGNSETFSGESICRNIDYFADLNPQEVCKIAYATGFLKGRAVSAHIGRAAAEARRQETPASDGAGKVLALRRARPR